jgi:hypothetical protein
MVFDLRGVPYRKSPASGWKHHKSERTKLPFGLFAHHAADFTHPPPMDSPFPARWTTHGQNL